MRINNLQKNIKNGSPHFRYRIRGGFTLVELIFYISIFLVVSIFTINALIVMTKSFKETTIQRERSSSSSIMERISREIRKSSSINTISTSDLKLNTTDDVGASKTVEFLLSSGNVQLIENSVLTGNLNAPNITVTALTFSQVDTTSSKAVRITLTIVSNNDTLSRSVDFYDTVVLRGSY